MNPEADTPLLRVAKSADTASVCDVLREAADWLSRIGQPMWRADELQPALLAEAVENGLFRLAECAGVVAGVVKIQPEDPLFWPDLPPGDALYVHRLAVRRAFAGRGVADALLRRACDETARAGRRWLRLDCEAGRPRLRAFYERFGFRHHDDRQVGPYFVARYTLDLDLANRCRTCDKDLAR